jgi:hypothetical protein
MTILLWDINNDMGDWRKCGKVLGIDGLDTSLFT